MCESDRMACQVLASLLIYACAMRKLFASSKSLGETTHLADTARRIGPYDDLEKDHAH